jgi:beta-aspartyl-peptidase (threonine type)
MKQFISITLTFFASLHLSAQEITQYAFVIHGGAGNMTRQAMSAEKEKAYHASLQKALYAGRDILAGGGSALDAVEAAIVILEDDSLFNAGRGAVFTNEGKNELDASIMDGKTLKAGAVAGVTTIRNPIKAARMVMDRSNHVMFAGKGAEKFARENGLEIVDPSYFHTDAAWRSLKSTQANDSLRELKKKKSQLKQPENNDDKYGTVGAVALDVHGNIAAATSTGGMTNKKFGRIGDSPIIGAGTYADNNSCGISCTGWGEYFIRLGMAKSVCDRVELKGMSIKAAAEEMIQKKLPDLGGDGGLIGIDKNGNIVMTFNTTAMYRAYVKSNGEQRIAIFKD